MTDQPRPAVSPPDVAEAEDAQAIDLLMRYRRGDRGAAGELFAAWFQHAFAYACAWLGDAGAAERVVPRAFQRLLVVAETGSPTARDFRTLLVEELHAAAADEQVVARRASQPRPMSEEERTLRNMRAMSRHDLFLLLTRLPARERRVLALLHVVKLELDGVAAELGVELAELRALERDGLRELRLAIERFGRSGSHDPDRLASHWSRSVSPVVRSRWAALPARVA